MKTILLIASLFLSFTVMAEDYSESQKELNREVSFIWKKSYQDLQVGLQYRINDIQEILKKVNLGERYKIESVNIKDLDLATPPVITQISDSFVEAQFPPENKWGLTLEVSLKVKRIIPLGSEWRNETITIHLKELQGVFSGNFHEITPGDIKLQSISAKLTKFKISTSSSQVLHYLELKMLTPIANLIGEKLINLQLKKINVENVFTKKNNFAFQIYGLGKPSVPMNNQYDFNSWETIANNIDDRIMKENLPYGGTLVLQVFKDKVKDGSWEEDFRTPYSSQGEVVAYEGYGDSAIWTGHFLAAQAFRFGVKKDQQSLNNVKQVLSGIKKLFLANGYTGLLARAAFPLSSKTGKELFDAGKTYHTAMIDGQKWVSYQGGGGVSRDQHLGVLFGLLTAYDVVGPYNQEVKDTSRELILLVTDYLIKNQWLITEDQRLLSEPGKTGIGTPFGLASKIKLTILLMAEHVSTNPVKYKSEIEQASIAARLAWFSAWISNADPLESYYKYNLGYINSYSYFQLEKDPVRRSSLHKAFDILEAYTAHHENPHFDLIRLSIEPEKYNTITPGVLHSLDGFLKKYHRESGDSNADLSDVEWTNRDYPGDPGVRLPKYPLEPYQRHHCEWFSWQRSPFQSILKNNNRHNIDSTGIDFSLPFWMARYYKVVPGL